MGSFFSSVWYATEALIIVLRLTSSYEWGILLMKKRNMPRWVGLLSRNNFFFFLRKKLSCAKVIAVLAHYTSVFELAMVDVISFDKSNNLSLFTCQFIYIYLEMKRSTS